MKSWFEKNKQSIFLIYVFSWAVFYTLFGTNLIHHNIKQFLFENLPIWLNTVILVILVLILILLWPGKIKSKQH